MYIHAIIIFPLLQCHVHIQTIHDWVLFLIVGVVVLIDVVIQIIGTAIPQAKLEASRTEDAEHEAALNVRSVAMATKI